MTGHPNDVADDQDEFWDFGEGAMTMTVDPATHYAEQAALACVLRFCEARDRFRTGRGKRVDSLSLVEAADALYRAGIELRTLYDSDDQL